MTGLDRFVGKWRLSGDVAGHVEYEWAQGRHVLLQHVDMVTPRRYGGRRVVGLWLLGHDHRMGEEPTHDIKGRFYSYLDGLTLDYVYEVDGDAITIWFGDKGSDNCFRGKFATDEKSYAGEWRWPGGGYNTVASRTG